MVESLDLCEMESGSSAVGLGIGGIGTEAGGVGPDARHGHVMYYV